MKNYRYAPLLAIGWFLVAGFAKLLANFDMPVESVNDNPVISSNASDAQLDEVAAVEKRAVLDVAASAKIGKKAVTVGVSRSRVCNGYYGYITVGGKNICLKSTDSTGGNLSYSYGYIFNSAKYNSYDSYIFGHNSAGLFGGLKNLGAGTRFSVTISGRTTNYQISKKVVYCDYSNPTYPCSNYAEPVLNMYDAVMPARQGANLAIMTCAGRSIGGGDATHRLVVFAKRV